MSGSLLQHSAPTAQNSRDVIDVDELSLNEDASIPGLTAGPSLAAHERRAVPQVIIVDDSDEEIREVAGPSRPQYARRTQSGQRRHATPRMRRRLLFSPSPPPPPNYPVPPVPPIPNASRQSRHRAPPAFEGVFMPMNRPFPFEDALAAQPPRAEVVNVQQDIEIPARQPPRRQNNMGLGGALLALNRRNEWEHAYPRLPNRGQDGFDWFFPGLAGLNSGLNALRRFFSGEPANAEDLEDPGLREAYQLLQEEGHDGMRQFHLNGQRPNPFMPALERYAMRQGTGQDKEQDDYKPSYTHPLKPESGFSNDFSQETITVIGDTGSSSSASNEGSSTILACAGCLDPLVINVSGPADVARKRKLWALRCGHILDGKCIDQIMKPPPPPPTNQDEASSPSSSGKGKEVAYPDSSTETSTRDQASSSSKGKRKADDPDETELPQDLTDRKGKGRAYPAIPLSAAAHSSVSSGDVPTATSSAIQEPHPESIRSRLRPRHPNTSHAADIARDLSQSSEAHDRHASLWPPEEPSATRRRGARGRGSRARVSTKGKGSRKGKGKPKPPVIEAEWVWHCPVASCRRQHKSHLINGEWQMAEDEGAIAMYV